MDLVDELAHALRMERPLPTIRRIPQWAASIAAILPFAVFGVFAWVLLELPLIPTKSSPNMSDHSSEVYVPPAMTTDGGPSFADLLAEAESERQGELEPQRQEQERERQAAVDRAATAAAAAVRSYYRHVDNGNASAAMALWYEVNDPGRLRGLINGTRSVEVLRIDRIRLDRSLITAEVPVLVRVTAANGRTECWSGPIAMNKYRGEWMIESLKGLRKRTCP
jgi:hypothetical protein